MLGESRQRSSDYEVSANLAVGRWVIDSYVIWKSRSMHLCAPLQSVKSVFSAASNTKCFRDFTHQSWPTAELRAPSRAHHSLDTVGE